MNVLTSTLAQEIEGVIIPFENTFGFGICGAYSAYLRSQGWGEVAVATATTTDGIEFPHYVVISNGDIIDMTNPFDDELTFSDVTILDHDEMPELVDGEVITWIMERI